MSAAKYEKLQQGLLALSLACGHQEKLCGIARESGGEFGLVSKVKSLYLEMTSACCCSLRAAKMQ